MSNLVGSIAPLLFWSLVFAYTVILMFKMKDRIRNLDQKIEADPFLQYRDKGIMTAYRDMHLIRWAILLTQVILLGLLSLIITIIYF
jgi:hypothetical protein